MNETNGTNIAELPPPELTLDDAVDWEVPEQGYSPTKTFILCEAIKFLTSVYRLVCVAMIIYALGAYAAVAIGVGLLLFSIFRCPDG